MRLFGKVDGSVNNRFDRAAWLTPVFDKDLSTSSVGDIKNFVLNIFRTMSWNLER